MADTHDTSQNPRRSVTAHDVAKLAGVSQSAVSRHFTPGASVSEKTRKKIIEAAKQLGYRPNLIARSLITKKTNLIGIVLPLNSNPYYQTILEELSFELSSHGYRILLFTNKTTNNSDLLMEEILHYPLDGLILIAVNLSSHLADECMQNDLPVVMMTRKTESNSISSVTGNNVQGVHQIVDFLLAGEHHNFAYLAGDHTSSTNRDREEAYFSYLKSHGIKNIQKALGNYTYEESRQAARELLKSDPRPDAIFCANDQMALSALEVAQHEFALKIGQDISIVGFDDNYLAAWESFQLTTFSQPSKQMVEQAIQVLFEQMQNHGSTPQNIIVEGKLIIRKSARLPK